MPDAALSCPNPVIFMTGTRNARVASMLCVVSARMQRNPLDKRTPDLEVSLLAYAQIQTRFDVDTVMDTLPERYSSGVTAATNLIWRTGWSVVEAWELSLE